MAELKARHPQALAGLSWQNWRDARLQMRAVVLYDKDLCKKVKGAATEKDQMLMCLAAYNGGFGGLMNDRTACRGKLGCDPNRWYGHVEHTSLKSRVVLPGYGRSPFQINREYPRNIDLLRQHRYHSLNRDP